MNALQDIFSNPMLALEAGILLGIGIGGILAIAVFLGKGE